MTATNDDIACSITSAEIATSSTTAADTATATTTTPPTATASETESSTKQGSRAPSVEDDEDGHLIYRNGDVLQDRCS